MDQKKRRNVSTLLAQEAPPPPPPEEAIQRYKFLVTGTTPKVLIRCLKWIMCPAAHTLLKVNLSCASVIKMIIEGRSPTMRHVSRTHRVALDWMFDRINLDPKIQIRHVDTKNQFADMLT